MSGDLPNGFPLCSGCQSLRAQRDAEVAANGNEAARAHYYQEKLAEVTRERDGFRVVVDELRGLLKTNTGRMVDAIAQRDVLVASWKKLAPYMPKEQAAEMLNVFNAMTAGEKCVSK
jgi:hypothetical protein